MALGIDSHTGWKALAAALIVSACVVATGAHAQSWPAKPIRIVVPWAPGGVVDVMTRIVTTRMSQDLGQPIVVENRPGANSNVGTEVVARATPDGYTLIASNAVIFMNPMIEADLRWQSSDFVPIARFSTSPSLLAVPASLPVNSLKEFIGYARSRPGLPIGDPGHGTPQSMAARMLQLVAELEFAHINYKGGAPIMPELINGTLSMTILPGSILLASLRSGRVKALATIGDRRSSFFPDVPTMTEEGFPAVTAVGWQGFHAPVGTPHEVILRLSASTGASLQTEDVRTRMASAGGETAYLGADAFDAFLREDVARWRRFVEATRRK